MELAAIVTVVVVVACVIVGTIGYFIDRSAE